MTAVAATLSRSVFWAGLTVYVAFFLTQSAGAAQRTNGFGLELESEPEPAIGQYRDTELDRTRDGSGASGASLRPVPPPGTPTPYGPLPPPAPPFRDTVYGAHANPGPPGSPGWLHPHFPEYQTRYGVWYQPRSFWEPQREVYRPQPFRPRGWGNLFVEDPCRHDRMDYNRYVVKDLPSRYGPSYYPLYQPPSECVIFRPERHYAPPVHGSAE